jgi:hypothetical protein
MATVKEFIRRRVKSTPKNMRFVLPFDHSFETGEIGDVKIQFPWACKVVRINSIVRKALADTDAGTLTAKNHAGTSMTNGVLTHAASAPLGNEQTCSPSANNTFAANEKLTITSAKSTAGGKVSGTVEVVLI